MGQVCSFKSCYLLILSDTYTCTLLASHMTVLPDLNGTNFPRPVDGHFEDGSYSAVARNMHPSRDGPSVLRDFRHFEVNNVRLLPGALSAVAGDQTVEYDDGDGVDVSEEAD